MPPFRTIIAALCIYIGVASAIAICPSNVNFKLEAAGTKKYLTPGYPCETEPGCGAFFSVNSSTGFEYTIAAGTSSLVIAKVPAGSRTPAGLYASGHDYVGRAIPVMFSPDPPTNTNCTIVPAPGLLDGSCNLECQGLAHGVPTNGQSINPGSANQWFLGRSNAYTKLTVKVRYT